MGPNAFLFVDDSKVKVRFQIPPPWMSAKMSQFLWWWMMKHDNLSSEVVRLTLNVVFLICLIDVFFCFWWHPQKRISSFANKIYKKPSCPFCWDKRLKCLHTDPCAHPRRGHPVDGRYPDLVSIVATLGTFKVVSTKSRLQIMVWMGNPSETGWMLGNGSMRLYMLHGLPSVDLNVQVASHTLQPITNRLTRVYL